MMLINVQNFQAEHFYQKGLDQAIGFFHYRILRQARISHGRSSHRRIGVHGKWLVRIAG